ncbi:MAG: RNA-directed DNA polymerase [Candidatus Acidiferrales bacterium]
MKPILKKGKPDQVDNYRPISLLSVFAKVFEMAMYNRIFTETKYLISPRQHGFYSGRSTVTNLACFMQYTSVALNSQMQVDAVYTDFSKAFDRLDHSILLSKLSAMGFDVELCKFINSYLSNRHFYVEHKGHTSNEFVATSGAPQGSNLAPLLFSLFVNDITEKLNSNTLLFADDLKLYRTIDSTVDCDLLQRDLDDLNQWCTDNRLPLNINKCKVMTFTLKKNQCIYQYGIQFTLLERVEEFRDLGVYFDSKLSFNTHVHKTREASIRMMGFVLRTCKHFDNICSLKVLPTSLIFKTITNNNQVYLIKI